MNTSSFTKVRRRFGWALLRVFNGVIGYLPLPFVTTLARILGGFSFLIASKKKAMALKSLKIAFPEKSDAERLQIAKQCFQNMAQNYCDMLFYLKNPQSLHQVEVEGLSNLNEALQAGKGVIGLTAHMGLFTLMHYKLAAENYPISVVARPMRNKEANQYFEKIRSRLGVKTIYTLPKKKAVLDILKSLRQKEVVIIQMDQYMREGGVDVKFFGHPAPTATGPVVFAQRTQSPVVPMYIIRTAHGRHCVKIMPPQELKKHNEKDRMIEINIQSFTHLIESWIRAYPDQWGWIHKRWGDRVNV